MALKRLDVWVDSKSAAEILGVSCRAIQKATNKASQKGKKICQVRSNILNFCYTDSVGGASGKVLQIWIDENLQGDKNVYKTRNRRQERRDENYRGEQCGDEMWECGGGGASEKSGGVWDKFAKETKVRSDGGYAEGFGGYTEVEVDVTCGHTRLDNNLRNFDNNSDDKEDVINENANTNSQRVRLAEQSKSGKRSGFGVEFVRAGKNDKEHKRGACDDGYKNARSKGDVRNSGAFGVFSQRGDSVDENTSGQFEKAGGAKKWHKDSDEKFQEAGNGGGNVSQMCVTKRLGRGYEVGEKFAGVSEVKKILLPTLVSAKKGKSEVFLNAREKNQDEALLKYELLVEYENRKNKNIKQFIYELEPKYESLEVNAGKIYRWLELVREALKNSQSPVDALIDLRGKSDKPRGLSDEMMEYVEYLILQKPHRSAKKIALYLEKKFKDIPTYSTITRAIKKWKIKNHLAWEVAVNPDRAKGRYLPAFGDMSENIYGKNQLWELDATPADVICSDGVRYIISGAIDVYSRRVVLVVAKSSNYNTLGRVMKKGIQKFGVPEAVKTDNGKEYVGRHFRYMSARLGIKQFVVEPFSGEKKPHIERFFGTLSRDLFSECDEYCGANVGAKMELENQKSFADRMEAIEAWKAQKIGKEEFAVLLGDKKKSKGKSVKIPLTKERLEQWLDRWAWDYEINKIHSKLQTTPMKKWEECSKEIRYIEDERILNILVGSTFERVVSKKGINIAKLQYVSNKLWNKIGHRVFALCDDDLGCVYVFDLEYNYICKALCPEVSGKSRIEYAGAAKEYKKAVSKYYKALKTIRENSPNLLDETLPYNDEMMDVGVRGKAIEFKQEVKSLRQTKEIVSKEDESSKEVLFNSPYERFYSCLKSGVWDELSLKIKQKYPKDYQRALENFNILEQGA